MSRQVGGFFLHAAHGPIAFAASCVAQNQVAKGLEELAPGGLIGGLERGVVEVASLAGVPAREVQSLLPWDELARSAKRLEASQPAALAAWRLHAGNFGFLDLITQLTVDGRPVEIRLCLERLAHKMRADDALAEPLLGLAEDIGGWEQLVFRCRDILDDGDSLARAWRLRRQRRIASGAVALIVMVSALGAIAWTAAARGRVASVLEGQDPCSALAIPSGDRSLASNEQDRSIAEKERLCTNARVAQAEAEALRVREEQERDRAVQQARAHTLACEELARRLAEARPPGSPGGDVPDPLAARIAARALSAADLGPREAQMPCWADRTLPPSVGDAIDRAFVDAILATPGGWVGIVDPSPRTTALLELRRADISPWQLSLLADRARRLANLALVGGQVEEVARAQRTCALARRLGSPGGDPCAAVEGLTAR